MEGLKLTVTRMIQAGIGFRDAVGLFRAAYTREAVEASGGNQYRAAEKIGVHRNSLLRNLRAVPGGKVE